MDAAPPGATNRLYKNNRDGTFTDVTEKAGLPAWAGPPASPSATTTTTASTTSSSPTGARTFSTATTATAPSPTSRKQAGLLRPERALGLRLHVRRLRPRRHSSTCSSPTTSTSIRRHDRRKPGSDTACNWKGVPVNCGPRGLPPDATCSTTTTATAHSPTSARSPASPRRKGSYGLTAVAADFDDDGWPDIYVACDSTPSLLFRNNHDGTFTEDGLGARRRAERGRRGAGGHGRRHRRLQPGRQPRYPQDPFRRRHQRRSTATTARATFAM